MLVLCAKLGANVWPLPGGDGDEFCVFNSAIGDSSSSDVVGGGGAIEKSKEHLDNR